MYNRWFEILHRVQEMFTEHGAYLRFANRFTVKHSLLTKDRSEIFFTNNLHRNIYRLADVSQGFSNRIRSSFDLNHAESNR